MNSISTPQTRKWIRVIEANQIPAREGRSVQFGAVSVAIFNTGETFVAVDNRCPHKGGPLADGIIGGTLNGGSTVTCPLHNWRVSLETGEVTKPCDSGVPAIRTYPVKVEDGIVLLSLESVQVAA